MYGVKTIPSLSSMKSKTLPVLRVCSSMQHIDDTLPVSKYVNTLPRVYGIQKQVLEAKKGGLSKEGSSS